MRVIPFLVSTTTTLALIVCLNVQWGSIPPLGRFLSPQHGFWQNAEPIDRDYSGHIQFQAIKDKADVYLDDRLVPHVFAKNEEDLYFIQGYIHAKFRLWQMEFQAYAAAGRISELVGAKGLEFDREKRRLGMVYAAERALGEMNKDSVTRFACDSYTAGVNAYIETLKESELPIEYKLLNYKPEKWSNLKTALFLKYMSLDLAGNEDDFEYSNAKTVFGLADFEKMYPYSQDSLDPIVPKGILYPPPGIGIKQPATSDSLYLKKLDSVSIIQHKPDKDNGSNNWAVSGKKTLSGAPILCNDPHLGLNLPSLWFEMQLSTTGMNVYGASFPGSPSIIIGFNDSCAFGFTNATRDVRDYYEIRFKDETMKEYWFNGAWKQTDFRYEHIVLKDEAEFIDTVAYTVFGPVMYDKKFTGDRSNGKSCYAVRWKAHDPSNELKMFNRLDHAKNYDDYLEAIQFLHTPGQNCVFASKSGDIAIWDQGEFPAKWKRQGDFIMPGEDSSYMWQGTIPQQENPHIINPVRQFVSSANQYPADPSVYPYYLGGQYPPYRGMIINRYLNQMTDIMPKDMMKLQTENYNVFAEMARPILVRNIDVESLNSDEKKYYDILVSWRLRNDPYEQGPTVFVLLWDNFTSEVWDDEMAQTKLKLVYPVASTLLEGILKDSAFKFLDNITTPQKETLADDVTSAFKKTVVQCINAASERRMEWARYKATRINHLLRLAPFSRRDLSIGGGTNCINATKEDHGPSWRMVVQLSEKTEAYGIYPGGQSGNPGSIYYETFVDNWVAGRYYPLWVMSLDEEKDKRIRSRINFSGL
ncbi:MAG TPA: penicillin acylase family protein [Puia sp.]|nr:penicillin acylase family protein [Puia sp.]